VGDRYLCCLQGRCAPGRTGSGGGGETCGGGGRGPRCGGGHVSAVEVLTQERQRATTVEANGTTGVFRSTREVTWRPCVNQAAMGAALTAAPRRRLVGSFAMALGPA